MIKNIRYMTAAVAVAMGTLCNAKPVKPNVIYILADDLGYGDLSCYGQKKLKTPNIDTIATEGVRFTNHYSGNTVCSPSRAVLMTGMHPGRVHCRSNGDETKIFLDPAMVTLPRLFKNAEYATGAFGKWGLGHTNVEGKQNPMTHGFDHFTGWKSQSIAHTYYPSTMVRDGKEIPLEKDTFVHDIIMDDAFEFIRSNAKSGKPFFCYIPTAVPHAAMHAPKELHEKWRKVFPKFDKKIGKYKAKGEYCPKVQNPIAGFAAMMENLDNQIGHLLAMLKELNIDDNTVIMFSSDNGAHREGGHNPKFWNSTGSLRGIKRDLYEGGIRTPLLVRWPSVIKAGVTNEHISAFWDIIPTMADIIGEPRPTQTDGISFFATLQGKSSQQPHPYLYWEYGKNPKKLAKAVRKGDWKAIQAYPNKRNRKATGKVELYNLKDDFREQKNLADRYPELVLEMKAIMKKAHHPLKKSKK